MSASMDGDEDVQMEVSWRANNGLWSLYQRVGRLVVQHPDFIYSGRHRLEFRARKAVTNFGHESRALEFVVDSVHKAAHF